MGETTTKNDTESRGDIYQRVTDRIIEAIEAGAGKWHMPWHSGADGMAPVLPVNAASKKPYRGINTAVLWATAQAEAYPSAVWATYRQWTELGAQVRKGEKASPAPFSSRRPSCRSACATQWQIDCAVGSNSRARSVGSRPARTNSTI